MIIITRPLALSLCLALISAPAVAAESLIGAVPVTASSAIVRLIAPEGSVSEKRFGNAGDLTSTDPRSLIGADAIDGVWHFEISFGQSMPDAVMQAARDARREGTTVAPNDLLKPLAPVSGSFRVAGGRVVDSALPEIRPTSPARPKSSPSPRDQVIPDDLIVQGGACVGLDCVNNESFGFDTIRLKENSTRIKFEDTSASGFPTHDWQLTANDSASGGAERFSIEDITAATVPFTVSGSAPSNALFIDTSGRIGLGTSTPVLNLHVVKSDTPAARLEQTNAGGFTAQTWDVAGNEANFFVRDVTGGSRLPFRIRPGAPTSAIDIAASGNVGIGTASPQAKLHVAGDAYIAGTLTQLSSRTAKTNLVAVAADGMLDQLARLPIWTWNYLRSDAGDRHIGPVAEDFYAAFGFGTSERQLAPSDVAGVALAATQALQREIVERDRTIASLEARLDRLERALTGRETHTEASTSGH